MPRARGVLHVAQHDAPIPKTAVFSAFFQCEQHCVAMCLISLANALPEGPPGVIASRRVHHAPATTPAVATASLLAETLSRCTVVALALR